MSVTLTHLIELAQEPSSAKRRELLRQVTNVFMSHPEEIAGPEMALYDEVMSQLSSEMEIVVRAEIAQKLSQAKAAPLGLLRRLASDDISVAEPILTRSKALTENDLLHVVQTQGQGHLRAVSQREEVPESVSGVIVERGDDTTVNTLLRNEGARLSRATNEAVVQRAQTSPALHDAVVNRKDMPADLMNDMYFVVEARLRERIMQENAKLDPAVIEQALSKSRNTVAIANGSFPADYEKICAEVEALSANQKLTPALLAKYMRDPNPTWFLCALATMADIDFLTAKHVVEKREIDALAIACKAADLDKALFLTYAMIMLATQENAMGRASEYGRLYEALPKETAMRTIRFWRMRRAEGHAA
ncbi:DUF2336 domain-containing protein [Asticcacaulis sp. BYS171W]|uniref:DUF2336 domain-containing protein n=1 Tax=Asticcacaulis aquaticus TaxID=2984212 RepID=A0ABT5HW83_9CAUL|nr:DUF2336 domain-containing protein [Asticcacaulis aquaticus]MDC7683691.1 DUF2336 domain-containing protein [Asticcacaulis aquaticus]